MRSEPLGETGTPDFRSLEELARDMASRLSTRGNFRDDHELDLELARDVLASRVRGVFLKQARDVRDGLAAALQQVVEVDYTILRLSAAPVLTAHELTVHSLDSHPIRHELGLASQTLAVAYRVHMDVDVGGGRVLWDAAQE